jgi:hypothetical protein
MHTQTHHSEERKYCERGQCPVLHQIASVGHPKYTDADIDA